MSMAIPANECVGMTQAKPLVRRGRSLVSNEPEGLCKIFDHETQFPSGVNTLRVQLNRAGQTRGNTHYTALGQAYYW
jgi:hypothetical protein